MQDEFVYILEGHAVVVLGDQEFELGPGDCIGFPAGGAEHQLLNRGAGTVLYLEVGDRTPGDLCEYPHDDLAFGPVVNGVPTMLHKDGTPYP